ncbi:hypothetical protein [Scrofimicrobium sp. R131]|uniref:Uncharacterized protein n=1 Tax=Scrofimicrobium appendicitidis TaxID=3079930 RepID=A0AAU7VAS1_9ACTO
MDPKKIAAQSYLELLRENEELRGELASARTQLDRVLTSRWWSLHVKLAPLLAVAAKLVPRRPR